MSDPNIRVIVGEMYNRDQYNNGQYSVGLEIPQEDRLKLNVHLAMNQEVSSFDMLLANFDKKYTQTYPINNKDFVRIFIGRGSTLPQVFQGKVEDNTGDGEANVFSKRLVGRGLAEDLFRRLVSARFRMAEGSNIVKFLIDNYGVYLSHYRGLIDLIEQTDTYYVDLRYTRAKLKEILDYIAGTADKAGAIGFDYREEYDGVFSFFPRGTKNSPVSLTDLIKKYSYKKSIARVRNQVYIFGAPEKKDPLVGDEYTEDTLDIDGDSVNDWTCSSVNGTVMIDTGGVYGVSYCVGAKSVKCQYNADLNVWVDLILTLPTDMIFDFESFPELAYRIKRGHNFYSEQRIHLVDSIGRKVIRTYALGDDAFNQQTFNVGLDAQKDWAQEVGEIDLFDWSHVTQVIFSFKLAATEIIPLGIWIDGLHANKGRWSAHAENIIDPVDIREYSDTDEELHSDAQCQARADAILDWLGSEAETMTLMTEILDFGNNRIQPGDMQPLVLANENVDKSFRVLTVDYNLDEEQELPITIELGIEPSRMADYIYKLRSKEFQHSRLKSGSKT